MHLEHVAIWTKDLERLKGFYEQYFDAQSNEKYINPNKGFESYFLHFDSGARLELMSMPSIPETKDNALEQFTGIIHLAFSAGSEQNVDQLTLRLKRDGYSVVDGPRHTGDGCYESVALDPDGNRIEITE
jgi:lactoylglutathione lyase